MEVEQKKRPRGLAAGVWDRRREILKRLLSYGILVFLVLLCIIFQWLTARSSPDGRGTFLTAENLYNILRQTSINTVIAVGMTFVIITGGIDLSVGSVVALAGVISMNFMLHGFAIGSYNNDNPATFWGLSWAVSIPLAVMVSLLTGAVAGLHNGLPVIKLRLPPFISTLAVMMIARGLAFVVSGARPVSGLPPQFTEAFGGISLVFVALAVVLAGHVVLSRTRFGRYVYAIGGNEEAARLSGVPVNRVRLLVYVLCGALAGLAGLLSAARLNAAAHDAGSMFELDAIAAVVLGGTSLMGGSGTVLGTLLGSLVIGALATGLDMTSVETFWKYVVRGYVILMALVLDQLKARL